MEDDNFRLLLHSGSQTDSSEFQSVRELEDQILRLNDLVISGKSKAILDFDIKFDRALDILLEFQKKNDTSFTHNFHEIQEKYKNAYQSRLSDLLSCVSKKEENETIDWNIRVDNYYKAEIAQYSERIKNIEMKIKDDEKKILKYRLALTQEPQIQAFQEMDIAIESLKQLKNQESISAAEILDVNLKMRHNTFENRMEKKPNDYNIVLPTIEDILNYVPPETRNNIKLTEKDVKLQELLEMIEKLEVEHSLHYKNEFQKNEQELVEIQNLILAEQESFRKNIISVKMESEKLNEISKRSILNRQKALIETANSFFGESE